jgi:hypothetical protein
MACWLTVESAANWEADRQNGFKYLGISDYRVKRATSVKQRDLIFVYIPSPWVAFSDIRIAEKDGVGRSDHVKNYDIVCYAGIFTEPLVTLPRASWVPLSAVRDHLSFGRHPSAGMQNSFRPLSVRDALIILNRFRASEPQTDMSAVETRLADMK